MIPPVQLQSWFCPRCGLSNASAFSFCTQCGGANPLVQPPQPQQQQSFPPPYYQAPQQQFQQASPFYQQQPVQVIVDIPKSRATYIVLGIFLGGLGIHNFYAGRTGIGVAQLLITIFTFWLILPILIMFFWVIIELITVDTDGLGRRMR